jgi:hypothetical protein
MDDTPERFSPQARAELMRALAPGGELAEQVDLEAIKRGSAFYASLPISPLRFSQSETVELCRAAKQAWDKAPDDARLVGFLWRGGQFFTTGFLGGIRVRDAELRKIADTRW